MGRHETRPNFKTNSWVWMPFFQGLVAKAFLGGVLHPFSFWFELERSQRRPLLIFSFWLLIIVTHASLFSMYQCIFAFVYLYWLQKWKWRQLIWDPYPPSQYPLPNSPHLNSSASSLSLVLHPWHKSGTKFEPFLVSLA
jgi:hypothetical protein